MKSLVNILSLWLLLAFIIGIGQSIDLATLKLSSFKDSIHQRVIDNPGPQAVIELPDSDQLCSGSLRLISIDDEENVYELKSGEVEKRGFILAK